MTTSNSNGNGNGNGNGKRTLPTVTADPVANLPAIDGFPASDKVYVVAPAAPGMARSGWSRSRRR